MGYLFSAISILAGAAKGFCGKKISAHAKGYGDASFFNFLRMMFCIVIGAALMLAQSVIPFAHFDLPTLLISLLSGVTTAGFVVFWIIAVKSGAYVMLDVFLMLGVGVTVVFCRIFLNEPIRPAQVIGFCLLVLAAYIMATYNKSIKGKMSLKNLILLIACGVVNGLTNFSQKLFVVHVENGNIAEFSFYTYIFSALTLFVAYLFFRRQDGQTEEPQKRSKIVFLYIGLMSAFLFLNSYFKTFAAAYLDSAVLYPLTQGAALLLSVFMAAVFFKEKITVKCIVGVLIAFAALLVINFL